MRSFFLDDNGLWVIDLHRHRPDDLHRGLIHTEDGVESLLFLCRVADIVVPTLPDGVLHLCSAAPSPEIAAGYLARITDDGEYILIIRVSSLCGRTWSKEESVSRIAELFEHYRTTVASQCDERFVDVSHRGVARSLDIIHYRVWCILGNGLVRVVILIEFAEPSPVVWPDMYAGIVYARQGMNGFEEVNAFLASMLSLGSCGDKMVRVEAFYES